MLVGEGEQPPVAEGVGRDVGVGQRRAGGVGDRGAVVVAMGIDPDDVVDLVCEHETDLRIRGLAVGPVWHGDRFGQDCDGSHPSGWTGF